MLSLLSLSALDSEADSTLLFVVLTISPLSLLSHVPDLTLLLSAVTSPPTWVCNHHRLSPLSHQPCQPHLHTHCPCSMKGHLYYPGSLNHQSFLLSLSLLTPDSLNSPSPEVVASSCFRVVGLLRASRSFHKCCLQVRQLLLQVLYPAQVRSFSPCRISHAVPPTLIVVPTQTGLLVSRVVLYTCPMCISIGPLHVC